MRRQSGRRWKPRNRALVINGVISLLLAVIHGMDYFYHGVAVHAIGSSFPRIGGIQLLAATAFLAGAGIAMIWLGSRPEESQPPGRD